MNYIMKGNINKFAFLKCMQTQNKTQVETPLKYVHMCVYMLMKNIYKFMGGCTL